MVKKPGITAVPKTPAKTTKTKTESAPAPAEADAASASLEGKKAPDFTLSADDGTSVTLSKLKGDVVVLYFYPKDNTPGCTQEACDFNAQLHVITQLGAKVFGVSRDSARTHQGFKTKHNLGFPLLVDADAAVHKLYGAWGEKKLYGKVSLGPLRTTIVVGKDGKLAKHFERVRVAGHVAAVLEIVKKLSDA